MWSKELFELNSYQSYIPPSAGMLEYYYYNNFGELWRFNQLQFLSQGQYFTYAFISVVFIQEDVIDLSILNSQAD